MGQANSMMDLLVSLQLRRSAGELAGRILVQNCLYNAAASLDLEFRLKRISKAQDLLIDRPWLYRDLEVDLVLLENQLPFFVLNGLYERASSLGLSSNFPPDFLELACNYFNINLDSVSFRKEIKHFTDLKRWEFVEYHPPSESTDDIWMDDLCSASMLYESGVKFKVAPERTALLDIKFSDKELIIPPLIVHPYTESHIRNVMALEQCHCPEKAYVSAYVDLMDHLINTEKDVELLVKKGVIVNRVGSAAAVADMINNLSEGVEEISHCYENIARDLIECYNSSFNRAIATLKHVYFNNLLRGTASVAAFLVVLFTFTQTLVAILERVNPIN
ncbi:hypothetical protein COLO4_12434 [Corchorus olitorius]|uniref:Uncharacterized protein n=1 Tax=Corchorus olitorius TaxID=93759 RepID=A0A1R3K0U8_9ROSI|nr:hypothetical protein COLO4_12434 [Corchorus olitorius]